MTTALDFPVRFSGYTPGDRLIIPWLVCAEWTWSVDYQCRYCGALMETIEGVAFHLLTMHKELVT